MAGPGVRPLNRNLLLLTLCQGLFFTNNVTFIAINGLVGLQLAPLGWMATLPIMAYVGGGALAAPLVARHQRRFGRKRCFQFGLGVAMVSAALCALAASLRSFPMLIVATVLAGYYNANGALYRFAAIEVVDVAHKERAISWVLAGGILGGVFGPNLATATRDLLPQPFTGAYVALMGVAALAWLVMRRIEFPPLHGEGSVTATGRPLRELARQPTFVVAIVAAALGYGVMNLLMAATPIAMQQCGHPFSAAALVLEAHVLAMFVPSFFTGHLIKRVGVLPVMTCGVAVPGLRAVRAVGTGRDALRRRAGGTGRRLELPLHRRHDPLHRHLPSQRAHHGTGGDGHQRAGHDGRHVVQLGRAGHHRWLVVDDPRLAGAALCDGAGTGVAGAHPLACASRSGLGTARQGAGAAASLRSRIDPATRSKRNSRHSIGPFHSGTRRDSFRRICAGSFVSGLSTHAVQPA